mgnify:CR=1 FL=1
MESEAPPAQPASAATEETKPVDDGGCEDEQALKEKAETLQKTLHEREKQLQVYAMQNARLMDLLSQVQKFVSCLAMYQLCPLTHLLSLWKTVRSSS